MKTGPFSLFRRALKAAPPVHPIDRRLAKEWVKRRLAAIYPELKCDPKALEAAYQELDLEPRNGTKPGDPHTYFEVKGG